MARPKRGAYPLLAPAAADVLARLALCAAQPDRLRLLSVLLGGERSVTDLAAALGLSPAKASVHVSVLRSQGMVRYANAASTASTRSAAGCWPRSWPCWWPSWRRA